MNITNGTGDDELDDKQDDLLASYTPRQRRTIAEGLRILARVAIRSYMREQAEQAGAEWEED